MSEQDLFGDLDTDAEPTLEPALASWGAAPTAAPESAPEPQHVIAEPLSVVPVQTRPSEELSLPELMTEAAKLAAIEVELKERIDAIKRQVNDRLIAEHKRTGAASHKIRFDGRSAGSWIVPEEADRIEVSDRAAFVAWCEERYPTEVDLVPTVKPAFEKGLLAEVQADYDAGTVVYTPVNKQTAELGEPVIVPGVTAVRGGRAKTPYPKISRENKAAIFERLRGEAISEVFGARPAALPAAPEAADDAA